jgi:hypothetical protein
MTRKRLMSEEGKNDDFHAPLERGLARFPDLAALVPAGYPRAGSCRVDSTQAIAFEAERTRRFSHNINLPLVLSLAGNEHALPHARSFASTALSVIDEFCREFRGTPGVVRTLEALWRSPWTPDDPSFWSVIAVCMAALRLKHGGAVIDQFEGQTGQGNATADICMTAKGQRYLLDVEMWHAAKGASASETRAMAERRANEKAAKKFASLPEGACGVVQVVCFADGETFRALMKGSGVLDCFEVTSVRPCIGQLIAVLGEGAEDGRLTGFTIADSSTLLRPHPRLMGEE